MSLTIWDYLIEEDAFDFDNKYNRDMRLLKEYNIIDFERDENYIKFIFEVNGEREIELMELTMETNLNDPYHEYLMFVRYQIKQIILKHWESNDYETVDVHGPSSKTVLSTIPLNEANTIWIEASINVEGEDDWYISDWEIREYYWPKND